MSQLVREELRATGVARVIVTLKPEVAAAKSFRPLEVLKSFFVRSEISQLTALTRERARKQRAAPPVRYYPNLGIAFGTIDVNGLTKLKNEKGLVAAVAGAPQMSLIRPTRTTAAKVTRTVTWGIEALGVPALWKEGLTGKGVLVGHLDTGVDGKHPALKKAIKYFAEFDVLGIEVRPTPSPHDTDGHGTHTAATIAGRTCSGKSIGVAPEAELASAVVIEGGDVVARVLAGMDWAVGKKVKVLSMSLGFRGWWDDFESLTDILRARGVLPVFAVGNEGPGTSRSPGNYWQALSVGAIDKQLAVADFSSSQRFRRRRDPLVPDIVAPGVEIVSAKPGSGYQAMDGTSMATPHIAGVAALLWQAKPRATVNEVETAIFQSCRLAPTMPAERANRGLPDAAAAVKLLLKSKSR